MGTTDGWHFPATVEAKRKMASYISSLVQYAHFWSAAKELVTGMWGFTETAMVVRTDGTERSPDVENVQNKIMHQEANQWRKRCNTAIFTRFEEKAPKLTLPAELCRSNAYVGSS